MKVSEERIKDLNKGLAETKNLMEGLAIDIVLLVSTTFPTTEIPPFPPKTGITQKMLLTAQCLYQQEGFEIYHPLKKHFSDTLRGLACYVLALHKLTWKKKLQLIKPLADDPHFGVREWAWLALRSECIDNLGETIALFEKWVLHDSEKIRRFAIELTRPRGVWCKHISQLRKEPWQAISLLEPLKNDPAKYVQLSVGNWLNDAGKDHPQWVINLCQRWTTESNTIHTQKICKRALRNLSDV